jgi:hypothetical protein
VKISVCTTASNGGGSVGEVPVNVNWLVTGNMDVNVPKVAPVLVNVMLPII